jgi:hypothetical protein
MIRGPNTIISELMPKTLDEIIRVNRDQAQLRLAKTPEIDALVRKIDAPLDIKDEIDEWRLVSFIDKSSNTSLIMLLGDSKRKKRPAITSPVVSIDFARGIALTRSHSVYKLGNRGLGEPPENDIYCLCAALHSWGSGAALGVPFFSH